MRKINTKASRLLKPISEHLKDLKLVRRYCLANHYILPTRRL